MHMNVVYTLTAVLARVHDAPEAVLVNACIANCRPHRVKHGAQRFIIALRHVVKVLFRYHKHMHGRLRLDIIENENFFILIHLAARYFTASYFAKNAVVHV